MSKAKDQTPTPMPTAPTESQTRLEPTCNYYFKESNVVELEGRQANKWIVVSNYSEGFYIARCWCADKWKFSQSPETQTVKQTYYKGTLRVTDAFDKSLIGLTYSGFVDFVKHPEWNKVNEPQTVEMDKPAEWWCLHCDDRDLETTYHELEPAQTLTVPVGFSLVVLEGDITSSEGLSLTDMGCFKVRNKEYTVQGDAKLFLIKKLDK